MSKKSKQQNLPLQPSVAKKKLSANKNANGNISKWAVAGVLILTAILYVSALQNGFASYDDDDYLIQNPVIKDLSLFGLKNIFSSYYVGMYQPLTMLTYVLEYAFFGLKPLPYHLTNVLLHLLNTWLVFKLVEKLSGKQLTALIVALLFGIHPMHVESVAWIAERKDVLYACFYLLSLIFYLKYMESVDRRRYYYFATLILFILSLLSKSAAVTLPVLLIAIDLYRGRKRDRRFYLEKIPFFALSIIFGVVSIISQNASHPENLLSFSYTWIDKIFLNTYALSFYLVKCLAPFHLSVLHFLPDNHQGYLPWQYYASFLFLSALVWLILRKASFRKELLFGIFFFLITVSVMLQIVQVGNAITAERYSYIPYIGLFYFAGQWLSEVFKNRKQNTTVLVMLSGFLSMLVYMTSSRIRVWKDGETLFTNVIENSPEIFAGYAMRSELRCNNGRLQEALADVNTALSIDSTKVRVISMRGDINYKLGDMNAAIVDFTRVLRLKPDDAGALVSRGTAYMQAGDLKSAFADFNKAIAIKPNFADAYNKRGTAYSLTGDTLLAMRDYNKAAMLAPYLTTVFRNRGFLKAKTGKDLEAMLDYDYAIKLEPDNDIVYFNRGVSKLHLNDSAGACNDWIMALKLGNKDAESFLDHYCR